MSNFDKRVLDYFEAALRNWHAAESKQSEPSGNELAKVAETFEWAAQFEPEETKLPDLALCRLSVRNRIASRAIPLDLADANLLYENRQNLGALVNAISDPALRDIASQVMYVFEYPPLGCMWSVDMKNRAKLSGLAALSFIQHQQYDKAHTALSQVQSGLGGDINRGALLVAQIEMILYLETERWGDLLDSARRARELTRNLPADDEDLVFNHALCDAVTGMAAASLGDMLTARNAFAAAMASPYTVITAWAGERWGLAERTAGDESKAQELFSKAQAMRHSPKVSEYQRDTSQRLRVTSLDLINRRESKWEVDSEPDPELEQRKRNEARRASLHDEAEAKLNRQIGLGSVKGELELLMDGLEASLLRQGRGIHTRSANLNTVFYGPPGTGKTTTAEVYAMRLAALGMVDDPKPVIVSRSDFVGDKEGESSIKTRATIDRARGKVLFIDEAYEIVQQRGAQGIDPFGEEAMTEIVALSEQRIGETVFIMAGYRDEMERLLKTNAGLDSRFPTRLTFPSYTQVEVAQIAQLIASDEGMVLSDEAFEWLAHSTEAGVITSMNQEHRQLIDVLGNGRFARNVVERAILVSSARLMKLRRSGVDASEISQEFMETITQEDVQTAFEALTLQHLSR